MLLLLMVVWLKVLVPARDAGACCVDGGHNRGQGGSHGVSAGSDLAGIRALCV